MSNQIFGTNGNDSSLVGTSGRDLMYGRDGADTLDGGEGNDNLYGGAGDDMLIGGAGNDLLEGGEGLDTLVGGIGDDVYVIDSLDDTIIEEVGGGRDSISSTISFNLASIANVEDLRLMGTADINGRGNATDNKIIGNSGNNNLWGGDGNDALSGGAGDDILAGGNGNDFLDGGFGSDLVSYKVDAASGVTVNLSLSGNQQVRAGEFDRIVNVENLEGTSFADRLTGNIGDNKIAGLDGGDTIRGGGGDDDITLDKFTNNTFEDVVIFEAAASNGVDRIRGFISGEDKLQFAAADGYAGAGFTAGQVAVGSGAQFVFDGTQGQDRLYFDADGDGAGAAIMIANLANLTDKLQASDIVIV